MADANGLVQAVKRAAKDEREASKPVNVFYGEVRSVTPLSIQVDQTFMLGEAQLVLTRNVTDHELTVTVGWDTEEALGALHRHPLSGSTNSGGDPGHVHGFEGSTDAVNLEHTHRIAGQKKITVHNALNTGDKVILLRKQQGQQFIVIDRIGGMRRAGLT